MTNEEAIGFLEELAEREKETPSWGEALSIAIAAIQREIKLAAIREDRLDRAGTRDEARGEAPPDEKPKRLLRNAARCRKCGDVIESKWRHNFVSCTCGTIFVDGGLVYQRFGYDVPESFEDLSEWEKT